MDPHVDRVVRTVRIAGGTLTRVIGGLDARGAGVDYPLGHVGPFLYLDDGRGLVGSHQPPFGLHPHTGIVVASYIPAGGSWVSVSNVAGAEEIAFGPGEVLVSNTGRGVVHDERSDSEGEHEIIQCVMRLPAAARARPGYFRKVTPRGDGARLLFDHDTLEGTGVDAALWHVRLGSGESVDLEAPAEHRDGFVYVRVGAAQVREATVQTSEVAVLRDAGGVLRVTAGDQGAELFVGTGAPIDEPWVKLLGHNGFVVEADLATAEARLADYARAPADFP